VQLLGDSPHHVLRRSCRPPRRAGRTVIPYTRGIIAEQLGSPRNSFNPAAVSQVGCSAVTDWLVRRLVGRHTFGVGLVTSSGVSASRRLCRAVVAES
jgi:hypothetical protein